jgi:tetratricopeptide (TPR) repeat protein
MRRIEMKKFWTTIICTLALSGFVHASDYYNRYMSMMERNEIEQLPSVLNAWQKASPNDIEMHIAYYNYYQNKARTEVPTMGQLPDGTMGIYNNVQWDKENVRLAIHHLDKALGINPLRMDVYFGKCWILGETEQFSELSKIVIDLLGRLKTEKREWLWSLNEPLKNMSANITQDVQGVLSNHFMTLYYASSNLSHSMKIAEAEVAHFPKSVLSWSHLGMCFDKEKKYKDAQKAYLSGLKINKDDHVLIYNLGYSYELDGNKSAAQTQYKKLTTFNNPQIVSMGNKGLDRLKTK